MGSKMAVLVVEGRALQFFPSNGEVSCKLVVITIIAVVITIVIIILKVMKFTYLPLCPSGWSSWAPRTLQQPGRNWHKSGSLSSSRCCSRLQECFGSNPRYRHICDTPASCSLSQVHYISGHMGGKTTTVVEPIWTRGISRRRLLCNTSWILCI